MNNTNPLLKNTDVKKITSHICHICKKEFLCVDEKEYPPCTCLQIYEYSEEDDCDYTYYFCSEECKKKA
jgi:hypothetical protein